MKLEGKNILITSNEPWGDIWFSKHNYAYELSRKNRVYFINPATRWSFRNLFKPRITVKKELENLYSVSYFNFLPSFFLKLNNRIVSGRIRKKLQSEGVGQTLFWSFDPLRLFKPSILNAEYSLFEAVDKYKMSLKAEKYIYANVDSIIIISEGFRDFYRPFNKPILTVSHALSQDEFTVGENKNVTVLTNEKSALYIGNLDHRVDYNLVKKMVEKFPAINFVFVGGMTSSGDPDFIDLFVDGKYPNVIYTGKRHFKELKYHVNACRFCIAPMKLFESNTISHHKIFQYLAFGKPVFSIEFSEYESFRELLYMDNDPDRLLEKIEAYLNQGEPAEQVEKRKVKAREFTFEAILAKIESFISEHRKS